MPFSAVKRCRPLAAATLLLVAGAPSAALAHGGLSVAGFAAGLTHPFAGLDHVLAMVAVGLWASQLGRPAVWLLHVTFPVVMVLGAVVGWAGLPLPWVESGIALSVLVLGAAIALALRPSLAAGAALVAAFALVHGHAHGSELPASASPIAYGLGFIAATLLLHASGLALGGLSKAKAEGLALRSAGAAVAVAGAVLFVTA